jgi:hypothetical protein
VVRPRLPILVLASVFLAEVAVAQAPKPRPTPTPAARPSAPPRKAPPRVFTNDDLEATKDKPSAVQNLTATGGETAYDHAPESSPAPEPAPTPDPNAPPPLTPEQERIQQLQNDIAGLDAQAKQLLWQQLQSTDTNEILRLKAEQQGVLDQLETARAELARLRGEGPPATATPEPTREPG